MIIHNIVCTVFHTSYIFLVFFYFQLTDVVAGRYVFRLKVTDDQGLSSEDTVSVIVKPGQYDSKQDILSSCNINRFCELSLFACYRSTIVASSRINAKHRSQHADCIAEKFVGGETPDVIAR